MAVADNAVVPSGGLDALQGEVLQLAEFKTATPNYGHRVLAMLLAEGAANALSWNWDTCIERAAPQGEVLEVARTNEDLNNLSNPQLAKVHGCAAMRSTLLITSEQLASPPVWTDQAFSEHVRASSMVFIGIGDVADYAQRRIREFAEEFFEAPDVRVASRSIRDNWDESVWAEILPDLPEDRRIQQDADPFFDELGRAWARELLDDVRADAGHLREQLKPGVERVLDALGGLSAVEAIRWCRSAVMRPATGISAVRAPAAGDVVMAAGIVASEAGEPVAIPRPACCHIGDEEIEVLVLRERAFAADVQREARRRAEELATTSQLPATGLRFLVGGTVVGRLDDAAEETGDVVGGRPDRLELIDGPAAVRLDYLRASDLLADAA